MYMYIHVGQIVNTHGNKGEVKVYPLTDDPARFEELKQVYAGAGADAGANPGDAADNDAAVISLNIRTVRYLKNMALLTFEEINDMNQAIKLKGKYLSIPETELKPLPEGRYYIYQLIGLDVYEGDRYFGKITEVLKPGGNDVYVVRDEEKQEILIPVLKWVVHGVDLEAKRVEVVLPPGLLEGTMSRRGAKA